MANGTDEGRPETVKDGERREARGSSGSVSLRSPFTVLSPTSLVPSSSLRVSGSPLLSPSGRKE